MVVVVITALHKMFLIGSQHFFLLHALLRYNFFGVGGVASVAAV